MINDLMRDLTELKVIQFKNPKGTLSDGGSVALAITDKRLTLSYKSRQGEATEAYSVNLADQSLYYRTYRKDGAGQEMPMRADQRQKAQRLMQEIKVKIEQTPDQFETLIYKGEQLRRVIDSAKGGI